MDMNLDKLRETVKDKEAWCAAVHGLSHDLATEQQQQHFICMVKDWGSEKMEDTKPR